MSGTRGQYDLNDKISSIIVRRKQPFRLRLWSNDDKDGWVTSISSYGKYNLNDLTNKGFKNDELTLTQVNGNARVILYDNNLQNGRRTSITSKDGLVNLKNRLSGYFNDKISSLWIFPIEQLPRYVVLYENDPIDDGWWKRYTNRGSYNDFSENELTWIDIGTNTANGGVRIYKGKNYDGESLWLPPGRHNLKNLDGWNDKVKSIRVY